MWLNGRQSTQQQQQQQQQQLQQQRCSPNYNLSLTCKMRVYQIPIWRLTYNSRMSLN